MTEHERPRASRTEPGTGHEREPLRRTYRERAWPHAERVVTAAGLDALSHWDPSTWHRES